jgi:ankyrin repeat protein
MVLVWLGSGLASILAVGVILRGCHKRQWKHEAARIVRAIETEDPTELSLLLVEGTDFHSVSVWFGEPALIIAAKSSGRDGGCFLREAVGLLISHGADINERGTECKTALMHAAANGNWDLCTLLLSYGADAAARDMFGRTATFWAQHNGYDRTASLLRQVEA